MRLNFFIATFLQCKNIFLIENNIYCIQQEKVENNLYDNYCQEGQAILIVFS